MNALILEDSKSTQKLLEKTLTPEFHSTSCETLAEAMFELARETFDLIIIDIDLPDGLGFDLVQSIKKNDNNKNAPFIFLTSRTDIEDRLRAFDLGAIDYITKPFHRDEVKARALLRTGSSKEKKHALKALKRKGINIDLEQQSVHVDSPPEGSEKLDLTPIEFKCLYALMKEPGKAISREELIKVVWGDVHLDPRGIDTHISHLRKKLGVKSNLITSVYGKGYSFCKE